jgi:DNA-binding Lrp family transcriptional regulator
MRDHRDTTFGYCRDIRKGPTMVQAFILVQTEVGRSALVASALHDVRGVESAEAVLGPYDVVVRIVAEDEDELTAIVARVQKVDTITRTLTCQVAEIPA